MLKVWPARPPSTPAGARVEGREMALLARALPSSILLCERPQKAIQPPDVVVANRDLPSFECRIQLFPIEFGHSPALTLQRRGMSAPSRNPGDCRAPRAGCSRGTWRAKLSVWLRIGKVVSGSGHSPYDELKRSDQQPGLALAIEASKSSPAGPWRAARFQSPAPIVSDEPARSP